VADDPRARNDLRQLVEQAVTAWREKQPGLPNDRMLCVFVDDLDRCSPEGVLEVFEAMKLYLDVPGIVFVVGYDQDIVSDLVLHKKGYSEQIKSRDYLEKFIQIVYRIPRAVHDRSDALVESLLATSGTADLFGPTERELVIEGSESNPRRIKRFVNGFVLAYGLDGRWREFEPQTLVRVQLLQMYFPDFARMLERPSEHDPIAEFLEYRAARAMLRHGDLGENDWVAVEQAFRSHEVGIPGGERDPDALLSRLEDNVDVAFVPLADREDFASLVQSIAGSKDWTVLREALSKGTLPQVSDSEAEQASAPRGARADLRLDGLRVLWVDDRGSRNTPYSETLIEAGALVIETAGASRLGPDLDLSEDFDVLVSDITRGEDHDAGFTELEELQAEGAVPRTVIFFTSRATPARIRRAGQLDALITTEPQELFEFLARAHAGRPVAPIRDER
jgi:hypothetical protein